MRMVSIAVAARTALITLALASPATAAEIAVLSTPTLKAAMDKLGPEFERRSGHKLTLKYATSAPLKRLIDAGESFDLAILVPASMDALIKEGKIAAETRTDISRSAIGVAIRAGALKPETGTVEAFRRTLLDAKSVSFSGEGASGKHFTGLIDRLGIGAEMQPKLRPLPGEAVVAPVAKGEVEIAVITIPNIIGVPGVEVAGLLPRDLQHYTVYTAGVAADAKNAEPAKALIALLMAPETTPSIEAAGMERIGPPGK